MGPHSDFKSHLASEISSFSSLTVSCPHRLFSPPFIDWYRLFGVRFFLPLFLLWGFFIFFPSLLIHSHRSNKTLQSISFVADILSLVGFVLFFSFLISHYCHFVLFLFLFFNHECAFDLQLSNFIQIKTHTPRQKSPSSLSLRFDSIHFL